MSKLPRPVYVIIAALTGTSITGLLGMIDPKLGIIAGIGIALLCILLAGYYFLRKWWQKRQSVSMRGQMQQHSAGAPSSINDPAKRAQLDSLKRNFDSGLDKFRTSGKDVYKLPWYLIVGEPGSGKTEAVRHCNVGFPPGLQDELQGVGGTINMNWWFTNRAVLLDTAGRLMFEEVKPGETSEWREFLQLLRRNRPNCPVNGLFLVIPTDSLIRDTAAEIARKAGKIAQQLDLIQRTLDVRFPVFILITKSDLMTGFREFFETFEDPATQHQMLGWSNPEPRDSVFHPEQVEQHLQVVVERIKKRRLGLLRDPIPRESGGRRADEVDALYSLPQSFSLIAPRLRSYLQAIFVAGEWSAKPLFLRGIYFTSSMREGSELDQELAEAIGVQLDDLPDGKAWERERAFFLRDLFLEKAFCEQGLVTKATNTKSMLKKRQLLVYGSIALASALFLGFTIYGYNQFKATIGDRAQYWKPAAENGWTAASGQPGPDIWTPIVSSDAKGRFSYRGDLSVGSENISLLEYHQKLRDLSGEKMKVGFAFRLLAAAKNSFLEEQRNAQRVVLEGSAIKPAIAAVRTRLMDDVAKPSSTGVDDADKLAMRAARLEDGVAVLIRVEAQSLASLKGGSEISEKIIVPALKFSADNYRSDDPAITSALSDLITWTYFQPGKAGSTWPPNWLALGSSTLKANAPIEQGLENRFKLIESEQVSAKNSINRLVAIRVALEDFRTKEAALNTSAKAANREAMELDPAVGLLLQNLAESKKALDAAVSSYVEFSDNTSLKDSLERLQGQINRQTTGAFTAIEEAAKSVEGNTTHQLFKEVLERIATKRQQMSVTLQNEVKAGDLDAKALETLEQDLLQTFEPTGERKYLSRFAAYERSYNIGRADATGGKEVIPAINAVLAKIGNARATLNAEKTGGLFPAPIAAEYWLDIAAIRQPTQIVETYVQSVRDYFNSALGFPLVRGGGKGQEQDAVLSRARQAKSQIAALAGKDLPKPCDDYKTKLADFAAGLDLLKHQEVKAGTATITVASAPDSSRYIKGSGEWQSSFASPNLGTYLAGESVTFQSRNNTDQITQISLGTPAGFGGKSSISGKGYTFSVSYVEGSPRNSELPNKADILQPLQ